MKQTITVIREYDKNDNMVYYKDHELEMKKLFNNDNMLEYAKYVTEHSEEIQNIKYEGDLTIKTISIKLDDESNMSNTTIYDKSKHHENIKYSDGLESNRYFDENDNLIYEENNKGYKCDYKYDDRGNQIYYKVLERPDTNPCILEVFREFDDHNNQTRFKLYKNGEVVQDNIHEFEYLENGNANIHSIYKYENLETWSTLNSKDDVLHYKDSNNEEYWNIIEGNKYIYKSNNGYESVSIYNDNGDIISFSDNKGEKIEYIYEDEYLK